MLKLKCKVQNYAWGKPGAESTVARLLGEKVDEEAALWMGVHPNGPSTLSEEGVTLDEFIKKNPHALAPHEDGTLQFLFKVLSVGKALSVQVHPTNAQARVLHQKDPKNYPDPHHKPEIAIALTDFELLCGFRDAHDLLWHIKENREIIRLFDEELLSDLTHPEDEEARKKTLALIFSSIWKSPQEKIASVIAEIIARTKESESSGIPLVIHFVVLAAAEKTELQQLMLRLDGEYPGGDVGVLAPIFLNYFRLKEGESTFLGPNEPHAYLLGDCVECMACSDNTIRAGLTPKFKDVETLCDSLTYRMTGPPYFKPKEVAKGVVEYAPPVPEFAVQKIDVSGFHLILPPFISCCRTARIELPPTHSSGILIVVAGTAELSAEEGGSHDVKAGDVLFVPATVQKIRVAKASADFRAFRAHTPKPH
ncbi:Mannose-6-phosphate isomerase [Aphelenchoides fujianensis]|nr:Mannose-6-phosphate isomerase [Aphelenchoides fujianensis]